jgi:hypothetical protein
MVVISVMAAGVPKSFDTSHASPGPASTVAASTTATSGCASTLASSLTLPLLLVLEPLLLEALLLALELLLAPPLVLPLLEDTLSVGTGPGPAPGSSVHAPKAAAAPKVTDKRTSGRKTECMPLRYHLSPTRLQVPELGQVGALAPTRSSKIWCRSHESSALFAYRGIVFAQRQRIHTSASLR